MSSITVVQPVVTRANSCYEDYVKFSKLPPFELDRMQQSSYAELHALRNELTQLLNEFRDLLSARSPASQCRRTA